jgi:BRCT domain type II-containing protein
MSLLSGAAVRAVKLAGLRAPGSMEVPDGVPDRLIKLSLVFTGEISPFSREQAIVIAKHYGGYVVSLSRTIHSPH